MMCAEIDMTPARRAADRIHREIATGGPLGTTEIIEQEMNRGLVYETGGELPPELGGDHWRLKVVTEAFETWETAGYHITITRPTKPDHRNFRWI